MTLEEKLAELFAENAFTWTLTNGEVIVPDAADIEVVLDEAVRQLYNGTDGDRLNVGRLIVEKREKDYDVYCYIGSYK